MDVIDRSAFKERMKEALDIDPGGSAVLTIDMQREYLDESVGQAVVIPDEAERVMASAKRMLDLCRDAGIPVIHAYVSRRHVEAGALFSGAGMAYMMAAQEIGVSQLPHRPARTRADRVEGSPESEVPEVLVAPGDIHVTGKKTLDSFAFTDLDFLLRRVLHVDTLLLSGINTDTCVYSTTFTAANLGYRPIVVADCVASMRGTDSHAMALELMARSIAWVLTLDELTSMLEEGASAPPT